LRENDDAGVAQVSFAAVGAQGDVNAVFFKNTFGEGFLRFPFRGRGVERGTNGWQGGFAFGGGQPAVVADLDEALGQDVRAKTLRERFGW